MGVGVIFTGCNTTDLSGINAEIDSLKRQITSLNQTITDLQTRLNESEENQDDLLLDLTTAKGQLAVLEEQVFGETNNYLQINETISYVVNGLKLLDFTPTFATITGNHLVGYTTQNYEYNFDLLNKSLNFSAFLYDANEEKTYEAFIINETNIAFSSAVPENLYSGLMYLYLSGNIWGIYEINFDAPLN